MPRGSYLRRIHGIAKYLTYTRGIETNRIAVIDGGYKEQFSTELWLIPEGANPPTPIPKLPQPSVNISSAYKFDEECLDCAEAVGLTLYGLDEGLQFYAEALRKYSGARGLIIVKYDDAQAFQHLEQVIMQLPHAKEQLEERMEQFKEARARWEAAKKMQPA